MGVDVDAIEDPRHGVDRISHVRELLADDLPAGRGELDDRAGTDPETVADGFRKGDLALLGYDRLHDVYTPGRNSYQSFLTTRTDADQVSSRWSDRRYRRGDCVSRASERQGEIRGCPIAAPFDLAIGARMQCALHPDRDASGLCHVCLKTVCVLCMSPLILDVTCSSCAPRILAAQKKRARLGKAIAVLGAGVVIATGAWAFQNYEPPPDQVVTRYEPAPPDPVELARQQHAAELVEMEKQVAAPAPVVREHEPASAPVVRAKHEPAPDWGKYAGKIHSLIASLQKEPCDRTKALELSQLLLRAHDNHGVLTHDEAFFAACGDMS